VRSKATLPALHSHFAQSNAFNQLSREIG